MYSKEKKQGPSRIFWSIIFVLFVLVTGPSLYYFWPELSFAFLENVYARLEHHSRSIESALANPKDFPKETLQMIHEAQALALLKQRKTPEKGLSYYYVSLFYFYELALRLPFDDQHALIRLTGRAFMPEERKIPGIKPVSIEALAAKSVINMRKALALEEEDSFLRKSQAHLILAYGTFLYTGRTDLRDLHRIQAHAEQKLSPVLERCRLWLSIVFYSLLQRKKELVSLLAKVSAKNPSKEALVTEKLGPQMQQSHHTLSFPLAVVRLLLCHGFYHAKDYNAALAFARDIQTMPNIQKHLIAESLRMEAEILYAQRGAQAAQGYFEQALIASGNKDTFIQERIQALYTK